jgi:hypothetical protein
MSEVKIGYCEVCNAEDVPVHISPPPSLPGLERKPQAYCCFCWTWVTRWTVDNHERLTIEAARYTRMLLARVITDPLYPCGFNHKDIHKQ